MPTVTLPFRHGILLPPANGPHRGPQHAPRRPADVILSVGASSVGPCTAAWNALCQRIPLDFWSERNRRSEATARTPEATA